MTHSIRGDKQGYLGNETQFHSNEPNKKSSWGSLSKVIYIGSGILLTGLFYYAYKGWRSTSKSFEDRDIRPSNDQQVLEKESRSPSPIHSDSDHNSEVDEKQNVVPLPVTPETAFGTQLKRGRVTKVSPQCKQPPKRNLDFRSS